MGKDPELRPEPVVEEIPPDDRHGMFVARNLETGKNAIVEVSQEVDDDTGRLRTFIKMIGESGGHN